MKIRNNKTIWTAVVVLITIGLTTLTSCTKYVDAGTPVTSLTPDKVYSDSTATLGAVLALYSYSNINTSWIVNLCQYGAMSADEGYYYNNASYDPYRTNTLVAGNLGNVTYASAFQAIGFANANIEGITGSSAYSTAFKSQLIGECKFWRAYCYFNLINYFGSVPLVVNTEVTTNAKLPRTDTAKIYDQIVADLLDAKTKVSVAYPSAERARVNQATVSALLARVYLYRQNWSAAETEATSIINSGTYSMESDLNKVFLKTSNEVIWQVISDVAAGINGITKMGQNWIPSGTTPLFVLYDTLANTFETGDQRKVNWMKSLNYNGSTFYYPYKYKIRAVSITGNEYNVMFRLAEQYLIRSEARAQQNKIQGAQSDLNVIRNRAGLTSIYPADKSAMITALEHERWVELFTEMSDRWFNLRRTGRIDAVLKLTKPQWQSFQALYPIPLADRTANPNLTDNPGY